MSCEQNRWENNESGYVFDIAGVLAIMSRESRNVLFVCELITIIAIFNRVLGPHSTSTWCVHDG